MRITVLDSDPDQAAAICDALAALGHSCTRHRTAKPALEELRREACDLLVMAWLLPVLLALTEAAWQVQDMPAQELVAAAHSGASGRIPVLVVIGRAGEQDALSTLKAKADDYIVAPVRRSELALRVQALLKIAHPDSGPEQLRVGQYTFEIHSARAWVNDREITLTRKEFTVALLLFRNLGRPLSRAYIQESAWPHEDGIPSRTIDTHVSRVRTKLGLIPENGYRLVPVYSFGYRLEELA